MLYTGLATEKNVAWSLLNLYLTSSLDSKEPNVVDIKIASTVHFKMLIQRRDKVIKTNANMEQLGEAITN